MKLKKHLLILIFIFVFCVFYKVDAKINYLPLLGKVIYVDPGHGGRDPGAIYKDIYESTINLEISKILVDRLEKQGAIVYMTRTGEYDISNPKAWNKKNSDLQNRVNLIEKSKADLYLSIHLNADTSNRWKGAQVFYDDVNSKNKKLADSLQDSFKTLLGSNRKVKEISTYYMYRRIENVPGVLLELGFLTNANERYLLMQESYQKKVSDAIIEGVINFYK